MDVEKLVDDLEAYEVLSELERESRRLYRAAKDVRARIKEHIDTADAQIVGANAMADGPAKVAALAAANAYRDTAINARQAWNKRFVVPA